MLILIFNEVIFMYFVHQYNFKSYKVIRKNQFALVYNFQYFMLKKYLHLSVYSFLLLFVCLLKRDYQLRLLVLPSLAHPN